MQRLRHWFDTISDFAQKAQAIFVATVVFVGLLVSGYGYVFTRVSLEPRAQAFFTLSIVLTLVAAAELAYIVHLRQLKEKRWIDLHSSCRGVDTDFASILQTPRIGPAEKRRRAIDNVLAACRDNSLHSVGPNKRRFAFLEYDAIKQRFKVANHFGLGTQSIADIERNLTLDDGLAGRAIKQRMTLYVPDIDADAAKALGWISISAEPRHKSLVCVDLWVADQPIGVLSVDCVEKHAFEDADVEALETSGEKIQLIYSALPVTRHVPSPRQPGTA